MLGVCVLPLMIATTPTTHPRASHTRRRLPLTPARLLLFWTSWEKSMIFHILDFGPSPSRLALGSTIFAGVHACLT